jgi:hypothetical protein
MKERRWCTGSNPSWVNRLNLNSKMLRRCEYAG